jgi:peptidoglycan-associated lipoprotein
MQHSPSQLSSGNIAPTVLGPQKDTKDVMILSVLVLFLGGLLAAAWYYGQAGDQLKVSPVTEQIQNGNVSEILKRTTVEVPPVVPLADTIHSDIYFEGGRKGLTDEAKLQLASHADMLKQHEEYGALIQGYTDQQGSSTYNKQLGLKRGEAVRAALLQAGVAEHRMKVVSLGEEGVLCSDDSDTCQHMNRRVHLDIRKIGQEHMRVPAAAASSIDHSDAGTDETTNVEKTGSSTETLVPFDAEPVPGS